MFRGQWVNDRKEGGGQMVWASKQCYEGEWIANKCNGDGRMQYPNGDVYYGQWVRSKRTGRGMLRQANGDKFEGEWLNDSKEGFGSAIYADSNSAVFQYVGYWKDGEWSKKNCATITSTNLDKITLNTSAEDKVKTVLNGAAFEAGESPGVQNQVLGPYWPEAKYF
jgi:hypothetical protein